MGQIISKQDKVQRKNEIKRLKNACQKLAKIETACKKTQFNYLPDICKKNKFRDFRNKTFRSTDRGNFANYFESCCFCYLMHKYDNKIIIK